jgi:hypothetical protein
MRQLVNEHLACALRIGFAAVLALTVAGCGAHKPAAGASTTTVSRYAKYRAGDVFTEPYADGRCGRQVTYLNFYVYEDIDPHGVSCTEAIHLAQTLALNVRARERAPDGDCFPGVCSVPGGMRAAGFRCDILAGGEGLVTVSCRRGAQHVEMLSNSEGRSRAKLPVSPVSPTDLPPSP